MISISYASLADSATIVELWNAKRLDASSCWADAEAVDGPYVEQLFAAGMTIALAWQDGVPGGFGLWCPFGNEARLVALAADTDEVYYRLMAEYCQWGIAAELPAGFAELGTASTTERERMDALGVISYRAIGYEPLLPGQPPESRVARLERAECPLALLAQALTSVLEGQS